MTRSSCVLVFYILVVEIVESIEDTQKFESVDGCPTTQAHWNTASARKACQGATPDYQCAAIEKNVGKFGEICTRQGLSPAYKCAVLNRQTYNLDFADCKAQTGCPSREYPSSEIHKYPVCYGDFYGTTTMMTVSTSTTAENITDNGYRGKNEDNNPSEEGIAILVVFIVITSLAAAIVGLIYFKRRKEKLKCCHQHTEQNAGREETNMSSERQPLACDTETVTKIPNGEQGEEGIIQSIKNEKDENPRKEQLEKQKMLVTIKKLKKYLVCILKNELEPKDLREKAILHSKSLTEHCNDQVIKNIENTTTKKAYDTFDSSLVYMLLTNFCNNITPPTREWDYDPVPDDLSIGADIERVKSFWNKMCDDGLNDIAKLKAVKDRMERRYGVTANFDEHFDEKKKKIKSVKFNPECVVEDGIIITQGIKSTLRILENSSVAICRGALGCGKTTALKHIAKKYEHEGWSVIIEEEQLNQLYELHTASSKSQRVLLCCDNFTGRYNFNSQLKGILSIMEKNLEETYKRITDNGSAKLLLLIHQHVYDELQKLAPFRIMQNRNITVEMDNLSRAEMLLIFKEQLKTGHCKLNSKCWFRNIEFEDVEANLKLNTGFVGNPGMTLVYTNLHEMFSDQSFSRSPLQSLERHFIKMKTEEPEMYFTLMYIMFVEKYKLADDLHEWSTALQYLVTKENIEKSISKQLLHCYVRHDGDSVEIKHDVMYIALFHACVKEDLISVLKFCRHATHLQLSRPSHLTDRTTTFSVLLPNAEREDKYSAFMKHFARRIANDEEFYSLILDHPLITDKFLKSQVKKYREKKIAKESL